MTKEIWKDIEGYGGYYQISNLGRVKRIEKEVMQFNHQLQKEIPITYPKKYLKFEVVRGYNRVTLSLNNKQERFQVHRIVADHFIPNSENKPHVHHKNHKREDNRAKNLMWVTPRENEHYKWKEKQPAFKAIHPDGKQTIWHTQMECSRQLGLPRNGIYRCLKGEVKSYRGYQFSYIKCPLEK